MNDRSALWLAAADAAERGSVAAMATVARKRGSLPLADDAKMVVSAEGLRLGTVGGGCVEAEVTAQEVASAAHGESSSVRPAAHAARVVIFGAGHVGTEIAKIASGAGFHVVVVDDRAEFANAERLPWAAGVIPDDFNAVLDTLTLDGDDFVVSATRGHAFDATIVERTATSAAGYVGMLGSKR